MVTFSLMNLTNALTFKGSIYKLCQRHDNKIVECFHQNERISTRPLWPTDQYTLDINLKILTKIQLQNQWSLPTRDYQDHQSLLSNNNIDY